MELTLNCRRLIPCERLMGEGDVVYFERDLCSVISSPSESKLYELVSNRSRLISAL